MDPMFKGIPEPKAEGPKPAKKPPAWTAFWEITPREKDEPTLADLLPEEEKALIEPMFPEED